MEDQDRTPGKPTRLERATEGDGIYVGTYDEHGTCIHLETWIVKRRRALALETIPPGRFALSDGYPLGVAVRHSPPSGAPLTTEPAPAPTTIQRAIDPTHPDVTSRQESIRLARTPR